MTVLYGPDGKPISVVQVSSSALPTGAATQATLATVLATLETIEASNEAIKAATEILDNIVAGAEAQVDVVSSALPTGAATSAAQTNAQTALNSIDTGTAVSAGLLSTIDADTSLMVPDIDAIRVAVETLENAIAGSEMQVDVLILPAVAGAAAQDAAISGNPVPQGVRASTAVPTAMSADGDVVYPWANRNGAQVVAVAPHIGLNGDPFSLLSETAQYTSAQTGVALVTPTSGKKLVVTKVQIGMGGTVAGTWILWFGASGDTTYTRGTDRAIFDHEFKPSATVPPGVIMDGPFIAGAVDDVLRVTGVGAINPQTVTVWYYEI